MSEDMAQSSGQPENNSSGDNQGQENKEPVVQNSVSYESHKKLLAEKKRVQAQLEELNSKFSQLSNEKLEAEGNKDKLIERLREEATTFKSENQKLKQTWAFDKVSGQFMSEAAKLGCKDPSALVKLLDFGDIDIDDRFQVNADDMKYKLEQAKKSMPYFFEKEAAPISDGAPVNVKSNEGQDDLSKLPPQDRIKAIALALAKQTNK